MGEPLIQLDGEACDALLLEKQMQLYQMELALASGLFYDPAFLTQRMADAEQSIASLDTLRAAGWVIKAETDGRVIPSTGGEDALCYAINDLSRLSVRLTLSEADFILAAASETISIHFRDEKPGMI